MALIGQSTIISYGANPFQNSFEEEKKSPNTTYTQNLVRTIDAPPSYSNNRVKYIKSPNSALRKKRKIRQLSQNTFKFIKSSNKNNNTIVIEDKKQHSINKERHNEDQNNDSKDLRIGEINCCSNKCTCIVL